MRRRWTLPISLGASAISAMALTPAAYLGLLTAAATRGTRGGRAATSASTGETGFVVCVPAHDEEATIGATIRSLRAQAYPDERFEVHVVADNCSDATAEIAAEVGACVHIRTAPEARGKGPALNWLHDRLLVGVDDERGLDFDVVVIVDADTLAEPEFLSALDRAFAGGTTAAQGYYGVRDPGASSAVALRYAALAGRHHLRPLGRNSLGGSCGLFGNGMAFRRDVLSGRRWTGHLVEDAEMQLELFSEGIVVDYVPTARIAAEMPEGLEQAASQNERWELGRAQLSRRYAATLVRAVIRGGPLRRRAYADALADLVLPPTSVLAAFDLGALAVTGVAATVTRTRTSTSAMVGVGVAIVLLVGHVLCALRMVRAPAAVYRGLFHAPVAIVWKIALLMRVARRPRDVGWTRTRRNAEEVAT